MERGQQPTIDQLLNKITFLRKALEYYSEKTTYACTQGIAPIDVDRGHQASFALEQTEDIEEYNKSLIEQYRKAVEEVKETGEEKGEQEALDFLTKVNKLMLDLGNKNK